MKFDGRARAMTDEEEMPGGAARPEGEEEMIFYVARSRTRSCFGDQVQQGVVSRLEPG